MYALGSSDIVPLGSSDIWIVYTLELTCDNFFLYFVEFLFYFFKDFLQMQTEYDVLHKRSTFCFNKEP